MIRFTFGDILNRFRQPLGHAAWEGGCDGATREPRSRTGSSRPRATARAATVSSYSEAGLMELSASSRPAVFEANAGARIAPVRATGRGARYGRRNRSRPGDRPARNARLHAGGMWRSLPDISAESTVWRRGLIWARRTGPGAKIGEVTDRGPAQGGSVRVGSLPKPVPRMTGTSCSGGGGGWWARRLSSVRKGLSPPGSPAPGSGTGRLPELCTEGRPIRRGLRMWR